MNLPSTPAVGGSPHGSRALVQPAMSFETEGELGTPLTLVVDDEPANVRLLQALLRSQNYPSVAASSGKQALAEIERLMPDIVLLDVLMPGMDGMEVCRAIKESPVTRHIAVVMVTGLASRQDRLRAIEVGADDFLTKPFDQAQLSLRIRSLWRMKSYHAGLRKSREELLAAKQILNDLRLFDRGILSSIVRDLEGPASELRGTLRRVEAGQGLSSVARGLEVVGRLDALMDELRALSELRAESVLPERRPVLVAEALSHAFGSASAAAKVRGVELSIDSEHDGIAALAEPILLDRMFMGLLAQALRSCDGTSAIEVRVREAGGTVTLSFLVSRPAVSGVSLRTEVSETLCHAAITAMGGTCSKPSKESPTLCEVRLPSAEPDQRAR